MNSFLKGRKDCGKGRKCWLPAFSPFPTMFSKVVYLRVVKIRDFVIRKLSPFILNLRINPNF